MTLVLLIASLKRRPLTEHELRKRAVRGLFAALARRRAGWDLAASSMRQMGYTDYDVHSDIGPRP